MIETGQPFPASASIHPEDRFGVVCEYYHTSAEMVRDLLLAPHHIRKLFCAPRNIDPHIFRTMLDYTRYTEAMDVAQALVSSTVKPASLSVLDFGCLVADYGIHFARLGAIVTIYDSKTAVDFARYRFARENLPVQCFTIPTDYPSIVANRDLAIFGEVLEHMDNPLEILRTCAEHSVRYIYTSCYPYGGEEYFSLPGHQKSAEEQQPACIELLTGHYHARKLKRNAVLWERKA